MPLEYLPEYEKKRKTIILDKSHKETGIRSDDLIESVKRACLSRFKVNIRVKCALIELNGKIGVLIYCRRGAGTRVCCSKKFSNTYFVTVLVIVSPR